MPRWPSSGTCKRLHRLDLDPDAAPVVQRIFAEFTAGHSFYAIAEGLTRDGIRPALIRAQVTASLTAGASAGCQVTTASRIGFGWSPTTECTPAAPE